ncbi:MAG: acyl-CoA synthetase, partial [Acidobacteria bacterium]|nr:acyl-CoA synthetase [Acidobacteriota bacterium]
SLEVERALLDHPAVGEAAVIARRHPKWGESPHAVVALRPGAAATESELIGFCRERLAHYKCPRSVELVDALPRTATGKVLKQVLRQKNAAPAGS